MTGPVCLESSARRGSKSTEFPGSTAARAQASAAADCNAFAAAACSCAEMAAAVAAAISCSLLSSWFAGASHSSSGHDSAGLSQPGTLVRGVWPGRGTFMGKLDGEVSIFSLYAFLGVVKMSGESPRSLLDRSWSTRGCSPGGARTESFLGVLKVSGESPGSTYTSFSIRFSSWTWNSRSSARPWACRQRSPFLQ